ncbi:MAG: hypothetical protein WCQ89_05615, partial [Verrucomicrobiota bacterium]
MNSPVSNPKLPAWIFIATDAALIAAAGFVAMNSPQPLPANAMFAIVGLVALGAIVGLVPLVAAYERQKNEALDDRQRALEALARTVSTSAEQISIAAGGLNEIAETAQRSARHAEQLPHKLQEKIAEFQAQLATEVDAEKEELERELLALRESESERLDTVSQRIAKSTAEWTKLEATSEQHLTAAQEALAKLSAGTTAAVTKAQNEAARTLQESAAAASKAIHDARASGRPVRVKLNTVRVGAGLWGQYRLTFDETNHRVTVAYTGVVTTGRAPVRDESHRATEASAPLECPVVMDYEATTEMDIFEGPT